jgi:hypothetical protein
MYTFSRILKRVEKDIDDMSDTTREFFQDIQESAVFQFLFGKKKKQHKDTKT